MIGALFIGSIVSVAYLYLALVITLSLCCLYVLTSRTRMVSFYRNRHQRISEEAKEYGRKILVSRIGGEAIYGGTFILATFLANSRVVGIFSLGILITGLIRWPLNGINTLVKPVSSKLYESGDMRVLERVYQASSRLILTFSLMVAAPLIFNPGISLVISENLSSYLWIFTVLGGSRILETGAGSCGNLLKMTGHASAHMKINLVLAAISLPLTAFLVIKGGLIGLTAGFIFSMLSNNLAQVIALYRMEGIQPFTVPHVKPLCAFILSSAFLLTTGSSGGLAATFQSIISMLIYLGAITVFGVEQLERDIITDLTGKIITGV